jgi:large subunit ribosomal protein L4e
MILMTKTPVLSLEGKPSGKEVELPAHFGEEFRPDVIRRACHAERTRHLQPKGAYPLAGLQTTAEYYGRRHSWRQIINTGRSRLPREKIPKGRSGRVLVIPSAVKGRRAHPPKPWKRLLERINHREEHLAIRSAIAATVNAQLVRQRGHLFDGALPLVVDDSIQSLKRVRELKQALAYLGLDKDLARAHEGRRMRSGRARLRKGGYRTPRSVLIVVGDDQGVWRAARNLPGVDVAKAEELTAELLAPGGQPARLTLWTPHALQRLAGESLYA